MSSSPSELPRRRNGRPQACEPCRRRKVSCGHEVPVCMRCRRRNTSKECVYIVDGRPMHFSPVPAGFPPADQSGALGTARLETLAAAAGGSEPVIAERRLDQQLQHPQHAQSAHAQQHTTAIISPPSSASHDVRHGDSTAGSPPPGPTRNLDAGYLGPTSFSAVYQETESSLACFQGQPGPTPPDIGAGGTPKSIHLVSVDRSGLDRDLLNKGVEVLQTIPDPATAEELFGDHMNPNDPWNRLAAVRVLFSVFSEFGAVLRQRGTAALRDMASLLSANSKKKLNENTDDPDEWVNSFSGRNLRWDSLGILFTYWAYGSFNMSISKDTPDVWSQSWQHGRDQLAQVARFKEAASVCISLADPANNYSTPMIYLRYRNMLLESNISGDASLALNMLHAELTSVATFAGMHAESRAMPYVPTAASEARRRLFGMLFCMDKVGATFTGRPPVLSRRYVSMPLPLDITNEVLMSDKATIAEAVSRLDAEGWNTDNCLHSTTITRARTQLACVRDAILEVAIGYMQDTSVENVLRIRDEELRTVANFPTSLTYNAEDVERLLAEYDGSSHRRREPLAPEAISDGGRFYAKVLVRLEHLKNMFFLERLLANKRGRSLDLLSTSIDMVTLTLVFWTHKNHLYGVHSDFDWLVMSYAAPSGGILCMELMNPTPRPVDETGRPQPVDRRLSRSNIIQQLSLLVGFLSWVAPTSPNRELCQTVKDVIQRVMDYTLNSPAAPPAAGQRLDLAATGLDLDMGDVLFNFDLMDTFDWLRPEVAYDGMQAANGALGVPG